MKKPEIEKGEVPEEADEEASPEEPKAVRLGQVATAHEVRFMTPDGDMTTEEYLVWLGNMFLDFKAAIAGN